MKQKNKKTGVAVKKTQQLLNFSFYKLNKPHKQRGK